MNNANINHGLSRVLLMESELLRNTQVCLESNFVYQYIFYIKSKQVYKHYNFINKNKIKFCFIHIKDYSFYKNYEN